MKRTTSKANRKTALHMIHRSDRKGIVEAVLNLFAGGEHLMLPKVFAPDRQPAPD